MNRKQAKEMLPIIQAFAEGKGVETKTGSGWISIENMSFAGNPDSYRIKPEVKYRPFKNLKECLEEMQCHIPYGWIKTDNNVHRLITLLDEDRTLIGTQETSWTYEKIFKCFTFMDGKPFGVRIY